MREQHLSVSTRLGPNPGLGFAQVTLQCRLDGVAWVASAAVFAALGASPGARTYYDALRDRNIGHHAALRQLANRLVGILHGCLKAGTVYNEHTAWAHHNTDTATVAA